MSHGSHVLSNKDWAIGKTLQESHLQPEQAQGEQPAR
jgi:hypothetical protein